MASPITGSATFTVPDAPAIYLNCPVAAIEPAGQGQVAIDALFNTWLNSVTYGGGCSPQLSVSSYTIPDACGGSVTVTWILADLCDTLTCSSTFTVEQGASLGDFVWNDLNHNGIQDPGEPGIPGVTVTLSGPVYQMTITDANGYYLFDCLPAGMYDVIFDSPGSTYLPSPPNQGIDDAIDSDPIGGIVTGVVLSVGENNYTIDAGFYEQLAYCSLTQGGFGNSGGNYCGQGTYQLIDSLLMAHNGMILGLPANNNTFTIPSTGAHCVINILPGGSTKTALSGNYGCGNFGTLLNAQGRLKNALLAQTIVLQLNVWWRDNLGSVEFTSPTFFTVSSSACDYPYAVPGVDTTYYTIPSAVYSALGPNPTVQDILDLANNGLGGASVIPSLKDIHEAVDLINNAFDECRFIYFNNGPSIAIYSEPADFGLVNDEIEVSVYPNPFDKETEIHFKSSQDSQAVVEIYNILGVKIAELFNDEVEANKAYTVRYEPTNDVDSQVLICIIRTSNGKSEKRIVRLR